MSWKEILKTETSKLANFRRFQLKLSKQMKKFGNHSEEVQAVWNEYIKTNPSEKEKEEFIAFFYEVIDRNKPPLTTREKQMKVIAEKQRKAREALNKHCGCGEEGSNIESVEKVAGAVTTGAPSHAKLFKPTFGGKRKKRCKKCQK
tara:strand:- start:1633 stop:2070 length:438 start_codon:yes stop_codon:yes gene_type:complete